MNGKVEDHGKPEDRLITRRDAGLLLSVSPRTIDRLRDRGILHTVYVGSNPRFRLSDIRRIIEGE